MVLSFFNVLGNLFFFALHIAGAGAFPRPLTRAEEEQCLNVLRNENSTEAEIRNAKDKLISHNLRLVAHVIKKYYANYSDQDDLISIGTIGLIKGINSFDSTKGTKLATYAARCIEKPIPS